MSKPLSSVSLVVLVSGLFHFAFGSGEDPASPKTPEPPAKEELPEAMVPGLKISKFAGSDLIKHPIGMANTADGKLLVVESHTHLRPKKYNGPESDQIIWLQDTDGDGTADKRSVFYGGNLRATMNIAIHPLTGAIYLATKNGVHRVWDKDGDGKADDPVSERVIYFDFDSEFLDNGYGCAGLCFDKEGNLIFGIGGLLGAPYTLESKDGIVFKDQGEGGNIWHCTEDGKQLRRFATGFWNPFGLCYTPEGHVFATDNDPSSRPPSRLHHVIDGGDYGYQYRYGRSGHHPFIAWDGELPGTLPMLSGTGDAPCDVLHHEGNLIVTSWSDHRVEVYPLSWNKTHYETEQKVLIKGGHEFRPVGMTVGSNGELYMTDWIKQDYQLHGHGAVWKVEGWQPKPSYTSEWGAEKDPNDPWVFSKMVSGHIEKDGDMSVERERILDLLHARYHNTEDGDVLISAAISKDQHGEMLKLIAYRWIADMKLTKFLPEVGEEVKNPSSATMFHAAITTKARLEDKSVMDDDLEKMLMAELDSPSAIVRRAAFMLLEDRGKIPVEQLRNVYSSGDDEMKAGVAITLRKHSNPEEALKFAKELMADEATSSQVKGFASLVEKDGPEMMPEDPSERGEFLFHKHCATCHRVNGFGRKGGPDLSRIGVRGADHIIQSVKEPSAELSPQYETWQVTMADGAQHLGFVLGEKNGIHFYSDAAGNEFEINTSFMAERERLRVSLMPPGLDEKMGEENFKHLVAWLESLESGATAESEVQ